MARFIIIIYRIALDWEIGQQPIHNHIGSIFGKISFDWIQGMTDDVSKRSFSPTLISDIIATSDLISLTIL
jgi:hypothetical protein